MTEQKLVKTHGLTVKVREKCLEAGLTTAYQLQVAANLAPSVAQHLFNENFSEISLQTLEKLLEALNCTAADILVKGKSELQKAKEILRNARRILILTGAGVSAESNVPTFRGGGGSSVWRGMRFEQLSSAQMVEENLPLVWEWFDYRRDIVGACEPNAAHTALADWQRAGDFDEFTLVTQNIDGLHRRAGSSKILELHGSIWRARCLMCRETFDVRDLPTDERPPVCKMCGDSLRPNVVLFGENLPVKILETAIERAKTCDVCLVIGTSSLVYPAASLPEIAKQTGAKIIEINPEPTALTENSDVSLRGKAGEIVPLLSTSVIDGLSDSEKYVSQTEAARLRGVSRQRIGQLVKSGRLRAVGEGHDALISVENLMNLEEGKKGRPRKADDSSADKKVKQTSTIADRMSHGVDDPLVGIYPDGHTVGSTSKNDSRPQGDAGFFLDEDDEAALGKAWAETAAEDEEAEQNQSENNKELVLDLATEGGGADIYRQKSENGGWTFLIEVSALNDDDFDYQPSENVVKTAESIDEAIKSAVPDHQIFILTPLFLHSEYRAEIKEYLENLLAGLTDDERARLQQFAPDCAVTPTDWIARADQEMAWRAEDKKRQQEESENDALNKENSETLSGRHFLLYWREESVVAHIESDYPLDVIASNQLGRVSSGDTIWLVTISSEGELILAGRMLVDKITDYKEAARIVSESQLWDADFYALPARGEAEPLDGINLEELAFELRFNSRIADRFDAARGKINPQQIQTMRELTIESAQLLTEIWESANAGKWMDKNGGLQPPLEEFEETARLNPDDPMAQYNLGVALDAHDETRRAIDAYRRAIELDPSCASTHYNLGHDYLRIGELEKAADCFTEAALLADEFAPAHFMLAVVRGELGDFHEAIAATKRGLQIEPDDVQAYSNLGNFYVKLGDGREALKNYERSLELAPDSDHVCLLAGKTADALGDFERAVRHFRRTAELQPDNFAAMFSLGVAYLKRERGADALPVFPEAAGEIDLVNPLVIYNLGLAFLALDMSEAAGEQIEVLEKMQSAFADDLRELCRAVQNRLR